MMCNRSLINYHLWISSQRGRQGFDNFLEHYYSFLQLQILIDLLMFFDRETVFMYVGRYIGSVALQFILKAFPLLLPRLSVKLSVNLNGIVVEQTVLLL